MCVCVCVLRACVRLCVRVLLFGGSEWHGTPAAKMRGAPAEVRRDAAAVAALELNVLPLVQGAVARFCGRAVGAQELRGDGTHALVVHRRL